MTTQHLASYGDVWSKQVRGLQTRVNASSLEVAKTCPRKYQYKIVEGREPPEGRVDTNFGTLVHAGIETYDRLRPTLDHEQALEATVHWVMTETWDKAAGKPLEFAHPQKSRESLIRVLVWYLDKYPKEGDLPVVHLPSGQPAIELPFEFDSGHVYASTGEGVSFIGRLDKIVELNGAPYISDKKTTKYGLGSRYFAKFSPNGQVSQYTLAGQVVFGLPIRGLIIDGIQVGQGWARFERAIIPRPKEVVEEWLAEAAYWLSQMEQWAEQQYWPQNDAGCTAHGVDCEFRSICALPPKARETWLDAGWGASRASKPAEPASERTTP